MSRTSSSRWSATIRGRRAATTWLLCMTPSIIFLISIVFSLIHLFDWSGLINTKKGLGDTFQVTRVREWWAGDRMTAAGPQPGHRQDGEAHHRGRRGGADRPRGGAVQEHGQQAPRDIQGDAIVTREERWSETGLLQYAKEQNVRVMVDAEQSYFQPAIHRLAVEMMRTYNTESAIVFNTQQVTIFIFLHPNYVWYCAVLSEESSEDCHPGPGAGQETELLLRRQAGARRLHGAGELWLVRSRVLSCDWPSRSGPAPSCSATRTRSTRTTRRPAPCTTPCWTSVSPGGAAVILLWSKVNLSKITHTAQVHIHIQQYRMKWVVPMFSGSRRWRMRGTTRRRWASWWPATTQTPSDTASTGGWGGVGREKQLDWILSMFQYLIFPIYSGWRSWDLIPRREFCVSPSCSECVIR